MATLALRDTAIFRGPAARDSTPTNEHAQMNISRISADRADPQTPDVSSADREHAVAQIETEQVRVGWPKLTLVDASGRVRGQGAASDPGVGGVWYGGWDSNPQALTGSRV
jgi:hypothetical protein